MPPSPQWLREALCGMDQCSLSQFLSFVTGCANMPVDGLCPPLLLTKYHLDGDAAEEAAAGGGAERKEGELRKRGRSGAARVDSLLPKAHTW